MTLTASTTLVSSTSPSGIMPMRAATVETMASEKFASVKNKDLPNNSSPTGIMPMPMTFKIWLMATMISEWGFLMYFTSPRILAA